MADEETQQGEPEFPFDADEQPSRIRYVGTEDILGLYADVAVVAHQNDIFSLYFYQLQIPTFVAGRDEAHVAQADAKCVARIVLTPQRLFAFYTAMAKNLERFKAKIEEAAKADIETLRQRQEGE